MKKDYFPLFAFMGDTTAKIFEKYHNELFQFPLIIIECSFIDNEQHAERAADVKHVLWVSQIIFFYFLIRFFLKILG